MSEAEQRMAVIAEAKSWIGTPWHHKARLKGVGVDCLQFVVGVFHACGLCPDVDTGDYSQDWMFHSSEELMIDGLMQYAREVDYPLPGDVVVFRFGRRFSHACIVTDYPAIIHAYIDERQVVFGLAESGRFEGREHKFFSVWGRQ